MKKILTLFFCLMVITLFAGCAQGGLHKQVSPEWKTPPSGLTVYVLDLKVQNGNDFSKALPDYVGKFNDWFLPLMTQDMVSMSGFAENFDAMTGEGLRDRSYTWTASAFLTMCHEYLLP